MSIDRANSVKKLNNGCFSVNVRSQAPIWCITPVRSYGKAH